MRSSSELQDHNTVIKHYKGKENLIVDALSRVFVDLNVIPRLFFKIAKSDSFRKNSTSLILRQRISLKKV